MRFGVGSGVHRCVGVLSWLGGVFYFLDTEFVWHAATAYEVHVIAGQSDSPRFYGGRSSPSPDSRILQLGWGYGLFVFSGQSELGRTPEVCSWCAVHVANSVVCLPLLPLEFLPCGASAGGDRSHGRAEIIGNDGAISACESKVECGGFRKWSHALSLDARNDHECTHEQLITVVDCASQPAEFIKP